jgi:CSLREA domain-containing protein
MKRGQRVLFLSALFGIILFMLIPIRSAYAVAFIVNNNGDASDANPGNGVCATAGAVCTLRAAIEEANANGVADSISFSGVTLVNIATELDITSNITINGTGVTVDNTGSGRVFNITSGTVIIAGLTITGGSATFGGGISVAGGSSALTLQSGAQVTGNDATTNGSGIFAGNGAQLTVTGTGTAVTANLGADNGAGIYATGAANVFIQAGATVSNHTSATTNGSGVYVIASGTTLTVNNATISGNTNATFGGGIYVQSAATVTLQNGAVVTQNAATGTGGGIYLANAAGALSVTASRITFNTAVGNGDAIFQAGGSTSVSNACIVCNGDNAIQFSGGTTPLALGGNNWWGTAWGPYYSTSSQGLQCSTGDSLNSTSTTLANYGISVTTPAATCEGAPPAGNWRTTTTAGCTGTEIQQASSLSHTRTCTPP